MMKHLMISGLLLSATMAIGQESKGECPMGHGSTKKTLVTENREAAMNKK